MGRPPFLRPQLMRDSLGAAGHGLPAKHERPSPSRHVEAGERATEACRGR
jgi:hypothetical protein